MVTKYTQGDVFASKHKTIIFATNTDGLNDAGFAGLVTRRYWPALHDRQKRVMGSIRSARFDMMDVTFHALVCHDLNDGGWLYTAHHIRQGLNQLAETNPGIMACVLMGSGPVGQSQGAPLDEIKVALEDSEAQLEVFYL